MRGSILPILLISLAFTFFAACDEDDDKKTKTTASPDFEVAFEDDFNRADGELGDDWVTDLPSNSILQIVGERVQTTAPDGSPKAFYTEGVEEGLDQRLSMDVIIDGGDLTGTDTPMLLIAKSVFSDLDTPGGDSYVCGMIFGQVVIGTVLDEDLALIANGTDTIPTADGDAYTITFTLEEDDLTCNVQTADGATEYEVTATDEKGLDGGYAGTVLGDLTTFLYFDNFMLETHE